MMKYLIDTHTFLWFSSGSSELSMAARETIVNTDNRIFISIASLWEISIKSSLGKLSGISDYASVIEDVIGNDIEIISINFAHTVVQHSLPWHHRDPFDRIIVAQAITEELFLISRDVILDAYLERTETHRIW